MFSFPFFMARRLLMVQDLLISDASHSHPDIPYSVGLLWTGDRPVAETSIWQHTTPTTDNYAPCGIQTRNPRKRAAADPLLRPRGPRFNPISYNSTIIALILIKYLRTEHNPVAVQMTVGPAGERRRGDHNQLFCSKDSDN
jgi:hypothetical protein